MVGGEQRPMNLKKYISCYTLMLKLDIKINLDVSYHLTDWSTMSYTGTVKPVHVVTSIKQSPVLKGHLLLVLS